MSPIITKEQLHSAATKAGLEPDNIATFNGSIIATCGIEAAMKLTFELACVLNIRPGADRSMSEEYATLVPMINQTGSYTCPSFCWLVEVRENPALAPVDVEFGPLMLVPPTGTVVAA